MSSPKVFLIVLNHNGRHLLRRCFDSVRKLKYKNFETVMVDNASTDGSQNFVKNNYSEVFLIQNPKNNGFPAGMNLGIRHALAEGAAYIALLNNDTEVDPGWISEMVSVAENDQKIGAVASRMMYMDNRSIINGLGVSMNLLAMCWDRHQGKVFCREMDHPEEVFSVCGGACLLRADGLREAGIFDESYIHYLEDADLCVRIRERGYRTVTAPRAVIFHKFSATLKQGSPRKTYFILRSRLRLILKFFPVEILPKVLFRIYQQEMRLLRRFQRERNWGMFFAQARALASPLAFVAGALAFRISTWRRFGYRVMKEVKWTYEVDALPLIEWDYRQPEEGEELPDRILMGTSDKILGDGWYPLEGETPSYRWAANRAECFLKAKSGEPHLLQLHLCQPVTSRKTCKISVRANGKKLTTIEIRTGKWQTAHAGLLPKTDRVKIALEVENPLNQGEIDDWRELGFQCNEVSLLPEDSNFLRR